MINDLKNDIQNIMSSVLLLCLLRHPQISTYANTHTHGYTHTHKYIHTSAHTHSRRHCTVSQFLKSNRKQIEAHCIYFLPRRRIANFTSKFSVIFLKRRNRHRWKSRKKMKNPNVSKTLQNWESMLKHALYPLNKQYAPRCRRVHAEIHHSLVQSGFIRFFLVCKPSAEFVAFRFPCNEERSAGASWSKNGPTSDTSFVAIWAFRNTLTRRALFLNKRSPMLWNNIGAKRT